MPASSTASSFPRKKRSTPASRIVATRREPTTLAAAFQAPRFARFRHDRRTHVPLSALSAPRGGGRWPRGVTRMDMARCGQAGGRAGAHARRERTSRRTRSWSSPGARPRPPSATSTRASSTSPSRGTRPGAATGPAASASSRRRRARLGPYAPSHRGVDVAAVLAQVEAPRERGRRPARSRSAAPGLRSRRRGRPRRSARFRRRRAATRRGRRRAAARTRRGSRRSRSGSTA